MTKMLDLLEDYLELRGWEYDRIDGMTHWSERQVNGMSERKATVRASFR
jgi:hypothetical protein